MATAYYKLENNRLVRVYESEMDVVNPAADDYAAIGAYPRGTSSMPEIPTDGRRLSHNGWSLTNGQWMAVWEINDGPELSQEEQSSIEARDGLKSTDVSDGLGTLTFDQKDALILNTIKAVKSLI